MLNVLKSKATQGLVVYYLILLVWWLWINLSGLRETTSNYLFGGFYAILAVAGGVTGLLSSMYWGGWRSVMGRGIIFLVLGLFGEAFGQLVWTFYNVVIRVEVPYPSIADIGYFSIVPFYSLAMISFAKAAGVRFSLKTLVSWFQVAIVPAVMLIVSYLLFLTDYEFDFTQPLKIFLDFGYPMGEAIMISIAILTLVLTRQFLGGVMKNKIHYIIFAFVVQYITDYTFLYQASRETYFNGGLVDLMYATSFLVMGLGLVSLRWLFGEEKSSTDIPVSL